MVIFPIILNTPQPSYLSGIFYSSVSKDYDPLFSMLLNTSYIYLKVSETSVFIKMFYTNNPHPFRKNKTKLLPKV